MGGRVWASTNNNKTNKKNSGLLSPKQPKEKPGGHTYFFLTTQEKTYSAVYALVQKKQSLCMHLIKQ